MNAKGFSVVLFCIVFLLPIVVAQGYKIEISLTQETFKSEENITFIVNIYDSENKLIEDDISVILQDIGRKEKIEKTVASKELASINLGQTKIAGEWKINAQYQDAEASESFFIIADEQIKFELEGELLIITNVGNIVYTPAIQITIGDTVGAIKEPTLEIGESITYRLVAPEGVYNIKAIDKKNEKAVLAKSNVQLAGRGLTGKAVGILDEQASQRSSITGGISPDEDSDEALLSYIKNSKFVYVFMLVIFGAMILLAIERRYKRKVGK